MDPILVALAVAAVVSAIGAAWHLRRRLGPEIAMQRRIALEELSAPTMIGPVLQQLAHSGWRIEGARSAHAEGFEHVVRNGDRLGLLGLRRGKQANLEQHQIDHMIGTARAWGADSVWLVCTGSVQRGGDRGSSELGLSIIDVDKLWAMHADVLSAGARAKPDQARSLMHTAVAGAVAGVGLVSALLAWALHDWRSAPATERAALAVPTEQPFLAPESNPAAAAENEEPGPSSATAAAPPAGETPPLAVSASTEDTSTNAGAGQQAESAGADPGSVTTIALESAATAPNQSLRKAFAQAVSDLAGVRKASWSSVSTLVIQLEGDTHVEAIADRACALASAQQDLGALRLQLLHPQVEGQPSQPRWRLCN